MDILSFRGSSDDSLHGMGEARMTETLNRPTPEGIALGKELARLTDRAEEEALKKFPNAKKRCGTCAYRLGTIPNGCVETVMDALKCALEFRSFMCHETTMKGEPQDACQGWLILCSASKGKVEAPWPYSADTALGTD